MTRHKLRFTTINQRVYYLPIAMCTLIVVDSFINQHGLELVHNNINLIIIIFTNNICGFVLFIHINTYFTQ